MLEAVAQIIFELVCILTGHAVLWIITLGRWNIDNGRQTATIVGILFWVVLSVGVSLLFFR